MAGLTNADDLTDEQLAGALRITADWIYSLGPIHRPKAEQVHAAADRIEALSQVTEEEVEAVYRALWVDYGTVRERVRAILEAARKART